MLTRSLTAAAIAAGFAVPAHAAFRTVESDASIVIPTDSLEPLVESPFSIAIWVKPEIDQPGQILSLDQGGEDVVALERQETGAARAIFNQDAASFWLSAGDLQPGQWSLITLSIDPDPGRAELRVRTGGAPPQDVAADLPESGLPAPDAIQLGDDDVDNFTFTGDVALVVIRTRELTVTETDLIAGSARLFTAFDLGQADPEAPAPMSAAWMIGHAASTRPNELIPGSVPTAARAAVIGNPVTTTNLHILDRGGPSGGAFRAVREVDAAQGFIHVSPFEDGRFEPELPAVSKDYPENNSVPAPAPAARRLIQNPEGLTRVMVSANSRGIQRIDGSFGRSANYADGFLDVLREHAAGVLLRPLTLNRHPWFAFSASGGAPWRSGVLANAEGTDFSRFFTGSASGGGPGPGAGRLLYPDASVSLRAKPAGLMTAADPLVVRAHALAYPGSSDLLWRPNHHTRQNAPGTNAGAPQTVALDTTAATHTFSPSGGDQHAAGELVIQDDLPSSIGPGDACAHASGIAVITEIERDTPEPGATTIRFAHDWQSAPAPGAELAFGPWRLETIAYEWPPLFPADQRVWRGLRLDTPPGAASFPAVVFAFDAWNPDADGFVIGSAGWGGNGYTTQINESQPGAMRAWIERTGADVWLQAFAQQDSDPPSMLDYTSAVRAALPDADVVWLGESEHGTGTSEDWHRYILENAEAAGLPAVSLLLDPSFGVLRDQVAAGLRSNSNHYSGAGATLLAERWLDRFEDAALPVHADLTGDGAVGADDLGVLLAAWGPCPAGETCPADLTGDGAVNTDDLGALLAAWD